MSVVDAKSIAIIGGGIGGQTAALYLLRAGYDVHMYEQSPQLTEAGAGLVVSPNATRLLIKLGLGDELAKLAVVPESFRQRRWQDGRTLACTWLGDEPLRRYGAPLWIFHRGDLHQILAMALPAERLHLGHRCIAVADRGDHVEVNFANGVNKTYAAVFGADGVHSVVRTAMLGPERPRFTGCIAYRGLIPIERVAHLDLEYATNNWLGPGRHFVHYPVTAGRMLNFVGLLEQDTWIKESWTEPGSLSDLADAYAGFAPLVREIIAAADHTFKWALLDRDPLPRWTFGRIALLGDACHPMLPFLGQGAGQAIEDGAAIAACLSAHPGDIAAGLKLYESVRMPRATKCQQISRLNLTRFHLLDGPEQEARDARMATGTTDWSQEAIGWLYGHDASVLPTEAAMAR